MNSFLVHFTCIGLPLLALLLTHGTALPPSSRSRHTIAALLADPNTTLSTRILSTSHNNNPQLNATFCHSTLDALQSPFFHHRPYPSHWNRYHTPWYTMSPPKLPTLIQSRHRVLLSSVRSHVGDGIGHMMFLHNFELFLATRLSLTFTHRHSLYQSLTKSDPNAVDRFFGWARHEIPRERIWAQCNLASTPSHTNHSHQCVSCRSLRTNLTVTNPFRHVVTIPSFLAYNCTSRHSWSARCNRLAHDMLARHNQSHTIFQIPPGACDYQGTNTNITETGPWFYFKYWRAHARPPQLVWPASAAARRARLVRYNPACLNIAVHVRRGDFFNEKRRRMLPDFVFATVLSEVLDLVDTMRAAFSLTVPVVHIYSEGRRFSGRGVSSHDVDAMDHVYYDERRTPRSARDWRRLIVSRPKSHPRLSDRLRRRTRVKLHISEDTLANMHEMIAADVFIGSDSSMSLGPIYHLSRGVKLVVTQQLRPNDSLHSSFDPDSGSITSASKFVRAWTLYEAANAHSLLHHLRFSHV